ncbi:hypothetical protein BS78_02G229100 [Paspalum vaginatum]|nr:hypothetical protein BS78_02G229100 [Paspalum vaginatum]
MLLEFALSTIACVGLPKPAMLVSEDSTAGTAFGLESSSASPSATTEPLEVVMRDEAAVVEPGDTLLGRSSGFVGAASAGNDSHSGAPGMDVEEFFNSLMVPTSALLDTPVPRASVSTHDSGRGGFPLRSKRIVAQELARVPVAKRGEILVMQRLGLADGIELLAQALWKTTTASTRATSRLNTLRPSASSLLRQA